VVASGDIICSELNKRTPCAFFRQLRSDYQKLAPTLDAYIFCMLSFENSSGDVPQDVLSHWLAYGHDGRGACLTLDTGRLDRLVHNTPGLRINPVIYQKEIQERFVSEILDRGLALASKEPNASKATIAAFVFATRLMKAHGFKEEREWRLIFMPSNVNLPLRLSFRACRDFMAPYIDLTHLWRDLCPSMVAIPALRATLMTAPLPTVSPPLVPITEVMIGPSGHQLLNLRALTKLLTQTRLGAVTIRQSSIPYRSLS
jgi:hypothetical protein